MDVDLYCNIAIWVEDRKNQWTATGPCSHDQVPQTPATPVSAESLASLLKLMAQIPDNEANRQFRQKLHQKHINATQLCFAERALLQTQNGFLGEMNNEGKVRRSTKSNILGKGQARIMLWDDLEAARAELAAKEKEKEEKKARKAAKDAEKEAKTAQNAVNKTGGKNAGERKRKTSPAVADVTEAGTKSPRLDEFSSICAFQTAWVGDEQRIAPVARMI
jgi:hypothetical protein